MTIARRDDAGMARRNRRSSSACKQHRTPPPSMDDGRSARTPFPWVNHEPFAPSLGFRSQSMRSLRAQGDRRFTTQANESQSMMPCLGYAASAEIPQTNSWCRALPARQSLSRRKLPQVHRCRSESPHLLSQTVRSSWPCQLIALPIVCPANDCPANDCLAQYAKGDRYWPETALETVWRG